MPDTLHIDADGSFDAASLTGGWAVVALDGDQRMHAASGFDTGLSNNTFEVLAAVKALSWIEAEAAGRAVTVWTDSNHVVEGCRRWRAIWRNNGWKRIDPNLRARRRSIPDAHLWQQLDALLQNNSIVEVELCKGHSGILGNDHADALARNVARIRSLEDDQAVNRRRRCQRR
ncbi:ribonuclease H family protein [Rhizobium sp. SU303]|uniref:ribonuclease H family protein n=1 Tax=Rhizobium sp. SU303 TaxID=3138065 RepID=UPI001E6597E6|nr:ribonuclease H [Rhizobium leguminosarum]UFW80142.1 ribonuclease HI [Rhizobium leguminosarum bv. viciae]